MYTRSCVCPQYLADTWRTKSSQCSIKAIRSNSLNNELPLLIARMCSSTVFYLALFIMHVFSLYMYSGRKITRPSRDE